jgi:hypothetical protein
MSQLSFYSTVFNSPALTGKMKDILLQHETGLNDEEKEAIIQSILTYESRVYDAARQYLESSKNSEKN